MPEVMLDENDRVDWALKVFKRRMQTAGILQELRRRRHYVKPSAARLLKSKAAKRARDKANRRQRKER
jgi:small subunit ribosomal protein S21